MFTFVLKYGYSSFVVKVLGEKDVYGEGVRRVGRFLGCELWECACGWVLENDMFVE